LIEFQETIDLLVLQSILVVDLLSVVVEVVVAAEFLIEGLLFHEHHPFHTLLNSCDFETYCSETILVVALRGITGSIRIGYNYT
jgi:hypothetical protein